MTSARDSPTIVLTSSQAAGRGALHLLGGLGLTRVANDCLDLLHDGRPYAIPGAILWHGGEGKTLREHFAARSTLERQAPPCFSMQSNNNPRNR